MITILSAFSRLIPTSIRGCTLRVAYGEGMSTTVIPTVENPDTFLGIAFCSAKEAVFNKKWFFYKKCTKIVGHLLKKQNNTKKGVWENPKTFPFAKGVWVGTWTLYSNMPKFDKSIYNRYNRYNLI